MRKWLPRWGLASLFTGEVLFVYEPRQPKRIAIQECGSAQKVVRVKRRPRWFKLVGASPQGRDE